MNKEDGSVVVLVNKEEEGICYAAVRSVDTKMRLLFVSQNRSEIAEGNDATSSL
jgi:hypothetical protein